MLLEPGVIRRALNREVERDFHLKPVARRNELTEILQCAQFRMHRIVAALGGADRVRASGIAFSRSRRVVAALAVGAADGVNGCEIDHVKTHRRDVRQSRDAILECAVLARNLSLAARNHLVPGAGARPRPVHHQWKQLRSRQVGAQLALRHGVFQFGGEERCGIAGLEKVLALLQDHGGRGLFAGLCLGEHARALDRIERKVSTCLLLEFEAVPPGGELVGPGLDRIDIASRLVRHERSAPAVVAVMGHRLAAPFPVALAPPQQRRRHNVMPVTIDIRPDFDGLSDDPLHRKAAAIDQRINILNMKSAAGRGALDSLSCFVHGDAIDMDMTSRFDCGKGDAANIYRKPLAGHWFPGNAGGTRELNTVILLPYL